MHATRERILAHLKRQPRASVGALAESLDLASMTVRQHLTKMSGDGLVEAQAERRPTGRPAHVYSLTPKGEDRFPKAYDRLAKLLLEEVTALDPEEIVGLSPEQRRALLFRRSAQRAAEPHRAELERLQGRPRLEAAAAIMRGESGFTELEDSSAGVLVREYNCVYKRVAEEHNDVCIFHTEYVSLLVGAPVELEGCQCDGANACTFRVTL